MLEIQLPTCLCFECCSFWVRFIHGSLAHAGEASGGLKKNTSKHIGFWLLLSHGFFHKDEPWEHFLNYIDICVHLKLWISNIYAGNWIDMIWTYMFFCSIAKGVSTFMFSSRFPTKNDKRKLKVTSFSISEISHGMRQPELRLRLLMMLYNTLNPTFECLGMKQAACVLCVVCSLGCWVFHDNMGQYQKCISNIAATKRNTTTIIFP